MKRIYTTLLLAAITLFACQTVSAYDFEVDGIFYNLNTSGMTVAVTHGDKKYTGDVVIPSSVTYNAKTLKVTQIGGYAFGGCTSLTSITIPSYVTTIGGYAFGGCTSLTSITIPSYVTRIEYSTFSRCTSLISVTIPNGVTTIEFDAFEGCTSLTSVTIPNSVTEIGREAFEGCTSLTSVTIPNSVTEIGGEAFKDCTSLSTVVLSENLTQIYYNTFQGCSQLTSINIPAHVREIERSAFFLCENLEILIFEDSDQPLKISKSIGDTEEASHLHPTYLYLGREIKSGNESVYELMFPDKVETLVFGKTYRSREHPAPATIKTVISKIEKPHEIEPFFNSTYANAILYVPKGTKALYESTDGWKQFSNIQEGDPTTGIVSTKDDVDKVEVSRYDTKGQKLNVPRKGINIVRYSDGTTEKIVVR